MFSHEPDDTPAGIPLQAHVEELRRRCEAVARLQGGSTHYLEEIALFRRYALEKALMLSSPPPEAGRPPSDEGNEHQVWFRPETATFL